ncbi:MAG: hypothetical protein IPM42_12685 [Saprospiraceae bacterium]|nr:hypothetical protein [Saprospiraceae bacterium]
MKTKISIFITTIAILFVSFGCKKDEAFQEEDVLVFGEFRGFCMGESCIEIFRLEPDKLFEDLNDTYPNGQDFYVGNWQLLSNDLFANVKDVIDFFPAELLEESRKVIGTPDSFDQGGYYIEYKSGDFHNFWIIDQDRKAVPTEYHEFLDKITAKVSQLQ